MHSCAANLLIMRDQEAVAVEVAQRFACAAVRAVADHGMFCVAVPGGSSPRRLFELLSGPDYSALIPWAKIHIFFTDERCVLPDHADSNYRQADDMLLKNVPITYTNIHRFKGELPPEDAARAYEQELVEILGNPPAMDLIILGMGSDTHTASLFPGSDALTEQTRYAAANWVEKLNTHRLTLTYPTLNSAREVIVLTMGKDKSQALKEALSEDKDPAAHPIHGVNPTYGRLLWIVDAEAASGIVSCE